MTKNLRNVYARKALSQIPRLLGNQDRNPFSPTYGCFHRDYWLDKTSDFPDAVRQFGVQSLALVYKYDFPGNIYKGESKMRDWAVAGMVFWASIQHHDGSFDEFYPYERGWVGPSAFTTFTVIEAFKLLADEISLKDVDTIKNAIRRAAYFIAAGESEEDHLANHHAMACLAVWKAYELLGDNDLKENFAKLWQGFLKYHTKEGWSREYDGVDPGYLSATVSFLAKVYQSNPDPEIFNVLRQSIEFCSYFVYPNGFYAGSLGSRNTLHFYPHGFEILASSFPLAGSVAKKMLTALSEGKLVPPEIMSDRYVFYRVSEFLQAYLDYTSRPASPPPLPYETSGFHRYFPKARIWVKRTDHHYIVANLAKGGVLKIFDCQTGKLICNDCGIIGQLNNRKVVTSQWIDPHYVIDSTDVEWKVSGHMNIVPSNKLFTPFKNIIFRLILLLTGWNPRLSHLLKGGIRKTLMLGTRPVPIHFERSFQLEPDRAILQDRVTIENNDIRFERLFFGDEFFVRYVPQSRYFQSQELDIRGEMLDQNTLKQLHQEKSLIRMKETWYEKT